MNSATLITDGRRRSAQSSLIGAALHEIDAGWANQDDLSGDWLRTLHAMIVYRGGTPQSLTVLGALHELAAVWSADRAADHGAAALVYGRGPDPERRRSGGDLAG
jgi:hypothetical protein